MVEKQDRRRFMGVSLAAGTALTLGTGNASQGDFRLRAIPPAPAAESNPQARPGRVRWHGDFAAACEAGRTSGKPVLLFHMLGRLDQKFC